MDELTHDSIFHGALRITQRRRGYRFTEDSVLLAAFAARGGPSRTAVDLGAGCGVVGLMLLHVEATQRAVAVELQPRLAELAGVNARDNRLTARMLALLADLRFPPLPDRSVDLVVSNPPFRPAGTGNVPRDRERAFARHELACTLEDLCRESSRILAPAGRLAVVYPAERQIDVIASMRAAALRPSRLQHVLPSPGRPPVLVLVEAAADTTGGSLVEERPIVSRDETGAPTPAMAALTSGHF